MQKLKTLSIEGSGEIICKDLKYCESFTDRMLGLLRTSNPRNLLFKTRFGIHSFLLSTAIDVVILNSEYKIVEIYKGFKPNGLLFWNPLYSLVLELKAGTAHKFQLRAGQALKIK